MILIADSSALIALASCNSLSLLDSLFHEVSIPKEVYEEIAVKGKQFSEELKSYLQNKIVQVDLDGFIISDDSLDLGELSAMLLYKKVKADLLLVDDKKGRKIAKLNEIKIIGSLGVLILAKSKNLIPEIKPLIIQMKKSEIHLAEDIVDYALLVTKEL